jgi:hypothetical protein
MSNSIYRHIAPLQTVLTPADNFPELTSVVLVSEGNECLLDSSLFTFTHFCNGGRLHVVWRILQDQQLYPYHPTWVHDVGPADFAPRVQFFQCLEGVICLYMLFDIETPSLNGMILNAALALLFYICGHGFLFETRSIGNPRYSPEVWHQTPGTPCIIIILIRFITWYSYKLSNLNMERIIPILYFLYFALKAFYIIVIYRKFYQ